MGRKALSVGALILNIVFIFIKNHTGCKEGIMLYALLRTFVCFLYIAIARENLKL